MHHAGQPKPKGKATEKPPPTSLAFSFEHRNASEEGGGFQNTFLGYPSGASSSYPPKDPELPAPALEKALLAVGVISEDLKQSLAGKAVTSPIGIGKPKRMSMKLVFSYCGVIIQATIV